MDASLAYSSNGLNFSAFDPHPHNAAVNTSRIWNNTDIPCCTYQHVYQHWPTPDAGARACQSLCEANATCQSWAYVSPNVSGSERCCLKDGVGPSVPHPGILSGFSSHALPDPQLPQLFPNVPETPYSYQIYPNTLFVQRNVTSGAPQRLLVHASSATVKHGDVAKGTSTLLTFSLRVDGFVALTANASTKPAIGQISTIPLTWLSGNLSVNSGIVPQGSNTGGNSEGSIAVQLDDCAGRPFPGYGLQQAVPFVGDSLAWTPAWLPPRDMSRDLAGRVLCVTVALVGDVALYSLSGNFTR